MDDEAFIDWNINREELKSYSLNEFDKEDGSVYGFMVLKLGEYHLGYLKSDTGLLEGDEDISFYVDKLIGCGIAILKGEDYSIRLLHRNLLEVHVTMNNGVEIEIWNTRTNNTEWKYIIRKSDLLAEIRRVYSKYIADVKDINENVLKSISFVRTADLYNKFLEIEYESVNN